VEGGDLVVMGQHEQPRQVIGIVDQIGNFCEEERDAGEQCRGDADQRHQPRAAERAPVMRNEAAVGEISDMAARSLKSARSNRCRR
jgi:hypothetical protein